MMFLSILIGIYVLFIAGWLYAFVRMKVFLPGKLEPKTGFSIVVAFKNEKENFPRLLASFKKIDYPANLFEIILVNDHSQDDFEAGLASFPFVKVMQNTGNGKKQALETGISQASFHWIITTDADCEVLPLWLRTYDAFIQTHQTKMLLGPVRYFDDNGFLSQFQQFEFLSLQALTITGVFYRCPFLANGANLVFDKQTFKDVAGYQGNEHLPSGDDVFLLEKFATKYPGKVHFVKSEQALVLTQAQKGFFDLIQQKIRWAGKSKYQKSHWAKIIGILILLTNLTLIPAVFWRFWWFIILKLIIDALLILLVNRFYKARLNPVYFVLSFILYPVYFILISILSLKGQYSWKGKRY